MNNFFDRFKPGAGDKKNSSSNPLAGWFQGGGGGGTFSGQGQSLGGGAPGQVISVTLRNAGPLGIKIEKSSRGTAIVALVVADSQAAVAGLERGDVLCFAGSAGREEIPYDMFLELAASAQRPLCFEVRRVPKTKVGQDGASSDSSAEAYARKQAVIAAAEKRERVHKKLSKPVKKDALPKILSTAERHKLEQERLQRIQDDKGRELSAATKAALEQAKSAEQQTVSQLGYNPYEAKSMTAGQARIAVTATTHGSIAGKGTESASATTSSSTSTSIPTVAAPRQALQPAEEADDLIQQQPSLEFQQAFETTVTSSTDHAAVVNAVTILRKLIVNATTKGQTTTGGGGGEADEAAAAKFRRVRFMTNPKIRAAVTDMPGAIDLLLAAGFQLHTSSSSSSAEHSGGGGGDDESVLVYPHNYTGPAWLPVALRQMEQYVAQS